jgi:oligoendopeptidase F
LRELVVPEQPLLAQCYDTIVADRLLVDRLRGYPEPMLPTHLENELEAGAVLEMLDAVEAAYPLAQRWLRVKAQRLELPVLSFSDIRAPLGDPQPILWAEAVELATEAFARVSPSSPRSLVRSSTSGGSMRSRDEGSTAGPTARA